jgi:hypothetical protein
MRSSLACTVGTPESVARRAATKNSALHVQIVEPHGPLRALNTHASRPISKG